MKNIPILSYLRRYWLIVAAVVLLVYALLSGSLSVLLTSILLVPCSVLLATASVLLVRHLLNRKTTDPYVNDSMWPVRDWADLTPFQRMLITKIEMGVYFLGACIIVTAILVTS